MNPMNSFPLRRSIPHRHRRVSFLLTGLSAILLGAGAWIVTERATVRTATGLALGQLPPAVRRADLNLLIVTLDTTRADRLGAYGFRGIETPHLDRLARDGVRFDQTTTAAPLTLPAHC